jgi:hypothetical protein
MKGYLGSLFIYEKKKLADKGRSASFLQILEFFIFYYTIEI